MNAPANFDPLERTAEIITFVARHQLPLSGINILPGLGGLINGGPQIAAAKAKLREIAARQKAEIERHQPPGSLGAAKVPPEIVWSRNERVVIDLRIGETERAVDETEAALIDSDRGLYRRGSLIVSTGFDKMQTWDGRTIEVQIIEERSNYALLEDIEAVASFERYSPKTKKRTKLPPPLALAITLKSRTTRLRLPNLVSVINCPTIKANGELISEPRFYADIGILFDPRGVKFPLTPSQPSKAAAMTALVRIMRLINTFDLSRQGRTRRWRCSLILTASARPCLPTAPCTASTRRSQARAS